MLKVAKICLLGFYLKQSYVWDFEFESVRLWANGITCYEEVNSNGAILG